ncbi:hypothetical protein CHLNCDRAFT_140631 [Chlorella variabilis]|uniref:CHY-type domain-containing protein n=1 Tax=Chlorella variabilis TaxID=554065 RepID=E1Z5U3_CHLVA|nr:hypothetical protein CHLNCDRAFT_140631 [Chlorella variabilis]EFN58817.1 hypothetical protein CHLNCDRAFT_140631 [Chlorella variabilis]|eukprot:XP_005850919.1 hypothetical protein CHLNCDRAFT_140631 [Chlorella variabilis]
MGHQSATLKQLQDELLQLKQQVPGLQLKKSTVTQSPAAPFPLTCRAEVARPPDAERYDVSSFNLLARLSHDVLSAPLTPGAVEVEVAGDELPRELRQAMAERLHSVWAASGPGEHPYQSEDAAGSTVRRWAVLSDQASITIDASGHPASAPKAALAAAAGAVLAHSRGKSSAGQQQEQRQPAAPAGAAAGAQAGSAALPRAVAQELEFLAKRHGLRQVPVQHAAGAGASPASAAGNQLAGLCISPAHAEATSAPASAGTGAPAAAQAEGVVAAFELELRPTDPAWPAVYPLLLHGRLSAGFPQAGCLVLQVSPQQQPPLPLLQRQVLDKLLAAEVAAAAGRPGALRNVVRQVENHAGRLWQQAEDIAAEVARRRRQQPAQQALQQEGPQQGQRQGAGSTGSSTSGSEAGSTSEYENDGYGSESASGGSGSSEGEGAGAQEGAAGGGGGGGHSDAVLPVQLQLESLQLDGCDALELLRLNLQLTCSRCKASGELSCATAAVALPSDGGGSGGGRGGGKAGGSGTLVAAAECGTCHAGWEVEVAPKLLHERSNVLAHVRCRGCTPADLLPSMLAGQCGSCASSAAFRSVAVGRWNERACSSCHSPMRFQFSTALFVPHRQGGRQQQGGASGQQPGAGQGLARPGSAAAAAATYNGLLQRGQPLPDRGTCKHYRQAVTHVPGDAMASHSYRWLRFPCCGRRFPCDLCHEENTDGHEMKWATSMVCGYCCLEQPVAPQCKGCSKKLATSASAPSGRHTRFWEGGKGQRDPSKLHKDDPRRYRSKFKTRSAKSKRVGQEAKARREREQQA